MQRSLESSVPSRMLDGLQRNDATGWSALAMRELRMLIARGQVYQARRIADMLLFAAEAGLPVEAHDRQEVHQLINAIDAVQAGRHYLARQQLADVEGSTNPLTRWATVMWRARSVAAEGDVAGGRELAEEGVSSGKEFRADAAHWATCVAAELQAMDGEVQEAEVRTLRVLSEFIGLGEVRGESLAYLSLANVHLLAGQAEESAASADMAYRTDGSWTGPPLWLAQRALRAGDVAGAESLLGSIPNPATNAYNLSRMLKLVAADKISLEAVLRTLELSEQPASDETVAGLEALLQEQSGCWPAREMLAWKLLLLGRADEAKEQRQIMAMGAADRQSVAAVGLGLQLYKKQHGEQGPVEPEKAAEAGQSWAASLSADAVAGAAAEPKPKPQPKKSEVRHSGFVGQISLFGVPELLQFLCSSRRSGVLVFSRQNGEARIRMSDGSLHWAESPQNPQVGQFLVEKAGLGAEQAGAIDEGREIASVLGEDGPGIDKIREALSELLHVTLRELVLEWTDGWFQFERGHFEGEPHDALLFNSQGILLDVMREIDEEQR